MTAETLPRVVATDLDGTLLRSDGSVSPRTRSALRAAEDAGIEVVLVTARPPRWLGFLSDVVGGHGRVVCLGGAAVWDLATEQALEVCGFADDDAQALVADLREAVPGVALALERADGPTFDRGFRTPGDDAVDVDPVDRSTVVSRVESTLDGRSTAPVGKLLARAADAGPVSGGPATRPAALADAQIPAQEQFFARVRAVVGDRAQLAYSGAAGLAELLAPTVSKDAALARWCARLGVDARDVWAFGDMPNDLPMLRWAGRSFAVANAHPDVVAAVSDRTVSNDDDGVALVLEGALAG
ncbi:HAD hydrolase family protein [Cellulosimicrobium arenosum]|uniref:HAD hydrolase family protein n=1 Tax=Cellulosimicrobium arenosum TaxID=2708133 RepID=A0A927PGW2_9MICO|nr:HAD hydrolase family protein [Cellulosimicrobium arenosum]